MLHSDRIEFSWRFAPTRLLAGLLHAALLLGGCAGMGPPIVREASHAIADPGATSLGRHFAAPGAAPAGASGFKVLATGHSAFVARAELADAAERTIDVQVYSAGDDLASALLLHRLAAAAERGVRVRILLDDVHADTRVFAQRAASLHAGIQVRMFNPFYFGGTRSFGRAVEFAFDAERLNRRMHNKLWVVDNSVALLGSRNLGDEYFGVHEASNFADAELLTAGPVVPELSVAFDAYWNDAASVPVQALAPLHDAEESAAWRERLTRRLAECRAVAPCAWLDEPGPLAALNSGAASLTWGAAQFFWDPPALDKSVQHDSVDHASPDDHPGGADTRGELLIVSPYFIPSAAAREELAELRSRGVRVAVLTNSLASTDSPAAHSGYARHRADMLAGGIELYEIRPLPGSPHQRSHRWGQASPASLHAKLIVQDRVRSVVGSFNQDPRSRLHNTEAWIAIESGELAADLAALFDEGSALHHSYKVELHRVGAETDLVWTTEENGTLVRHFEEPMASGWLRMWRGTLGALIPEHLL